ncbi:MAG: chemotaxis protein CheW [Panacagrimonas sp.]
MIDIAPAVSSSKQGAAGPAVSGTRHSDGGREGDVVRRWIGFELAGQLYGVPILAVQEVLASAEIEPVPGTPREVLGVINLRGHIVTVVDLRLRLGLAAAESATGPLVVFDGPGETLAARVDCVTHVRRIPDPAIKPSPRAGSVACAAVIGVVTRDGELMTLLDVPALMR